MCLSYTRARWVRSYVHSNLPNTCACLLPTHFPPAQNLRRVARELGETLPDSELQAMLNEFDTDGDGALSLADFSNIIMPADV